MGADMQLIADGLLIAAAATAAIYCYVLSQRLSALSQLDSGLGAAIAGLSDRIELTRVSLAETKSTTTDMTRELQALTARAEIAASRLELLLATLPDGMGGSEMTRKPDAASGQAESSRAKQAKVPAVRNSAPDPAVAPAEAQINTGRVAPGRERPDSTMVSALRKIAERRA